KYKPFVQILYWEASYWARTCKYEFNLKPLYSICHFQNESQSVITSIKSQSNTVHRGFFTAQRRFLIVIAALIGTIVVGGILAVIHLMGSYHFILNL
ncbi:unnamed protein product, partial [Rotaria magnacalcarata]